MKNTEALNTLQAKDPSFSSKWCGERKQKKLKGERIALGGEAVLSQWQGVENYEAGNEDGDHGECETGEDASEGDHEEQGAGVSEGGEMVCNTQQDGKDSREEEEKDEDDEEMAKLFVKSLKTHLPQVHSFGGDSKGHEKQLVPTANSCTRKGTTKDSTGIRKRALDATVFGGGVSWSPQTGLHGKSQKHHGKQLSKPETIWQKDGQLQDGLLVPPRDPHKLNKLARKQAKDSAGAKWFDLPAPTITPELKKELQLLKLRGTIDPKRHYKAEDSKSLPKYFQVGTVVEGPADFYSGRLTKKERKGTLADELLSNAALKAYRKRKYLEIQDQKQAGGKKFWNQRKNRQKPSWAKT